MKKNKPRQLNPFTMHKGKKWFNPAVELWLCKDARHPNKINGFICDHCGEEFGPYDLGKFKSHSKKIHNVIVYVDDGKPRGRVIKKSKDESMDMYDKGKRLSGSWETGKRR